MLYERLKLVESILITMIAHLVAVQNIIHEATQWVTELILKIMTIMNKFAWIDRIVNSKMMSNKNNTYLLTAPYNDQNYMELQKFYTKD